MPNHATALSSLEFSEQQKPANCQLISMTTYVTRLHKSQLQQGISFQCITLGKKKLKMYNLPWLAVTFKQSETNENRTNVTAGKN